MRKLSWVPAVALVATVLPVPATAEAAIHLVTVKNGRFSPASFSIAIGDSVEWLVQENGHTISASDYRFDYDPDRTLTIGETRSWTFTEDETFRYICRIHAPGMSGVITVGAGSPLPPPPPPITGESRRVPTNEFPTIEAALAGLPPDSEVILEPGTYPPFTVTTDEVLIRGARPDEVDEHGPAIIDGVWLAKTGITVLANKVRLRALEVVNVADRAIRIGGDDAVVEYSVLQTGLFEGIAAADVTRLRITEVELAANPAAAGIALDNVDTALIESATIAGAQTGVRARSGRGIVVRDSTIAGTGTGIALRGGIGSPLVGAHVYGNTIIQTMDPLAPPDPGLNLVTGAGIWLDATWSATVQRNTVTNLLTYGIAITGIQGPTLGARSLDNEVTDARIASEGWDGIGTACTTATDTEPPTLSVTNACGSPNPGIPYPKVSADLVLHAGFGPLLREL